jgi:hypothetical protein
MWVHLNLYVFRHVLVHRSLLIIRLEVVMVTKPWYVKKTGGYVSYVVRPTSKKPLLPCTRIEPGVQDEFLPNSTTKIGRMK